MTDGPVCFAYLGELGWEYLRFQGYCRRYALDHGSNHPYYVCTYGGREIMYQDFCCGSITNDWWIALQRGAGTDLGVEHGYGFTGLDTAKYERFIRWVKLVMRSKYGIDDCEVICPPVGIKRVYENALQYMKALVPDEDHVSMWHKLKKEWLFGNERIVAVFPRKKDDVRDWGEERYRDLIKRFQADDVGVVIGGHPRYSACESLTTRYGVVNLMHYPNTYLLSLIIAALEDCEGALGGQSALPSIALGQGKPTTMWGCERVRHSEYYNWASAPCCFLENPDYSISSDEVYQTFWRFMKNVASIPREELEKKEWCMVKAGEVLPNEKRKP